jgi:hypothetical protein
MTFPLSKSFFDLGRVGEGLLLLEPGCPNSDLTWDIPHRSLKVVKLPRSLIGTGDL